MTSYVINSCKQSGFVIMNFITYSRVTIYPSKEKRRHILHRKDTSEEKKRGGKENI
jgi:hypothetical protein